MEKVAEGIQGDIPDAMVEEQAHQFVENFARQLQAQGLDFKQYMQMTGSDDKAMLEQAKEPALRQVRLDLAVAAIVKAEGLEASEEEITAEYDHMSEQYGMKVEDVKKYISADVVSEQILRNKAIAVVVDNGVAVKPEEKAEDKAEEKTED